MKGVFWVFVTILCIACNTEPQPLTIGKDECDYCKMPVADLHYGAEIITAKGKLYKFDDMGCMFNFLKNGLGEGEKVNKIVAVNYSDHHKMIDVNKASFLKSPGLRTPMNSGIAAFESLADAQPLLKDFPGEIISWQQFQQKWRE